MHSSDSHCHLESFENLEQVLAKCKEMLLITSGHDAKSNRRNLEIAKKYKKENIYCILGVSPYAAIKGEKFEKELEFVRENAREHTNEIVGIGEIGLDFHWGKTPEEIRTERECFSEFLELAFELDKPLVIHSRDAEREVLEKLIGAGAEKVMMHCFSGSVEEGKLAEKHGYLISVPPIRSKTRKKLLKELSIETIVLETDAPYIGKTPLDAAESAEIVSSAKGIPTEEVIGQATKNLTQFFKL